MKRLISYVFTILFLFKLCTSYGQLSEGIGETINVPNTNITTYLPKHFKVKTGEAPGVMHHESGTFVILIEVPDGEQISVNQGLSQSFFQTPGIDLLTLQEQDAKDVLHRKGRLYQTAYNLQGYGFERMTFLFKKGSQHYLIIGNYSDQLKDQVFEEVVSVMQSMSI